MPTLRGELHRRYGAALINKVITASGTADLTAYTVPDGYVYFLWAIVFGNTVTASGDFVLRDGTSNAGLGVGRLSCPLNETTVVTYPTPIPFFVGVRIDMITASTFLIHCLGTLVKIDSPQYTDILKHVGPSGLYDFIGVKSATTDSQHYAPDAGGRQYWLDKITIYGSATGPFEWKVRNGGLTTAEIAGGVCTNDFKQYDIQLPTPIPCPGIYYEQVTGTGTGIITYHGWLR